MLFYMLYSMVAVIYWEEVAVYMYTVKFYHLHLFFKLTLHYLILYKYFPTNYVKKPTTSRGVIN
jgi:hypothetical protein